MEETIKKEKPKQIFDNEIRTVEKEEGTIEEDLKNFKKLSNPKKRTIIVDCPFFSFFFYT